MLLPNEAPICAIATPAGRGAIGIVRISGRELADLDLQLTGRTLADRIATYGPFLDDDGSAIDHGLAIRFAGPRSYTGEDVLELQGHGGPVVQQLLLQRVLRAGAALGLRPARPGEFTERAYLNDKLDLAQAEAVADLIDASTVQAARSAVRSLTGEFSLRIRALADQLLELRLLVEATLDFPEEEIEFIERADGLGRLRAIEAAVAEVLATARQGALLTEGMAVVLVGAPNVGKSSLLNALAGAEIAIVTPVAGTTRDRISQVVAIDGVPLNLIDTAGLHQSDDMVERIGIARTWEAIERADVIVHLLAADAEVRDEGLFRLIDQRAPAAAGRLTVINKIDLVGSGASVSGDGREVRVSALTGAGVDLLRTTLLRLAGHQPGAEGVFAARERHLQALRETLAHLSESQRYAAAGDRALELFAEELRLAHRALGLITGEVSADALLGVIFSRFCIGK